MKAYLVSLAAGVVVGLLYSVMEVKSPAPPTVALVGLLGMLGGNMRFPSCEPGSQPASIEARRAKTPPTCCSRLFAFPSPKRTR